MINGFEEITAPLTDKEIELIPAFKQGLEKHVGEDNPVTSKHIIFGIQQNYNVKINGSQVRKIINAIRRESIVTRVVASSKGYYREPDDDKFKRYIESLRQRAGAIDAVADSLEEQIRETVL